MEAPINAADVASVLGADARRLGAVSVVDMDICEERGQGRGGGQDGAAGQMPQARQCLGLDQVDLLCYRKRHKDIQSRASAIDRRRGCPVLTTKYTF